MSSPVTVPTVAPLARIPGVELIHTGQWDISNMDAWVVTTEDIAAAVAALDCPAVRRPVLKLGHTDPRFDGEPAVGWIDHLAATSDGHTLIGDYVGMPGWLGEVLASAYPDRSIEGIYDYVCQIGHQHPFVLDAVALLGVTRPGIGTLGSLQDIAQLYGVAAAARSTGGTPVRTTVRASEGARMPNPTPTTVAAGVTTEDVRRAYYDDAPWSVWIEEFQLDPLQLIVIDDNNGQRSRVPIEVGEGDGEDAVTFGAAIPVVVRYEDVSGDDAAVAAAVASDSDRRIVYASRAESRPGSPPGRPHASPPAPAAGHDPTEEGSPAVAFSDEQLTTIRERLGLADDATDADILTAIQALPEPTEEEGEAAPAAVTLPEGVTTIDTAQLEQLQVAARRGEEARTRQEREDREQLVDAAIADGRIPPARRASYITLLETDPGTAEVIAAMEKGVIPVGAAVGHSGGGDHQPDPVAATRSDAAYKNWSV